MASEEITNPEPSKLGTKEYWDQRYEMELENFQDCGDEGEIWFGQSAENRIVKYLKETCKDVNANILDLGCGNGSVLRKLRSKGFVNLMGIDYCPAAIELSRSISQQDAEENESTVEIGFEESNILCQKDVDKLKGKFAYVLDKGTWDAMSLSDDREVRKMSYKNAVLSSLLPGGRLVLFSCNFTKEELSQMFGGEGLDFEMEIPATHTISFGGKQGVTSTGVVFLKK